MLLLVLILVLIAFGLLLVGFLSASVLWAWVSVAVSVGAAGVLLFDTLQRRSVVRAGDDAGGEPPVDDVEAERTTSVAAPARSAFGAPDSGRADVEPVTEIIPVVRPPAPQGSGVDPRFDPDADAQQTVMMPAVQPSGSPSGPSGATPGQTPSSESSSPSVTFSKGDPQVPDGPAVDEQSTVVVRAAGQDTPADPGPTTTTPAMVTTSTPVPPDDAGAADEPSDPDTGARVDDGPAAGLVGAAGSATAARPTEPASADPDEPAAGGDAEATTAVTSPPRDERAAPPAEEPGSLFASRPGTNGTSQAPDPVTAGEPPPPGTSDTVVVPPAQVAEPSAADAPPSGAAAADVPDVDGEAPEEQSDPQVAAVVAGLEDEVLVIDEQPRYHVGGCRALAAVALIPLPVREAVELGFTPCGWCGPDRALASRHRASAR